MKNKIKYFKTNYIFGTLSLIFTILFALCIIFVSRQLYLCIIGVIAIILAIYSIRKLEVNILGIVSIICSILMVIYVGKYNIDRYRILKINENLNADNTIQVLENEIDCSFGQFEITQYRSYLKIFVKNKTNKKLKVNLEVTAYTKEGEFIARDNFEISKLVAYETLEKEIFKDVNDVRKKLMENANFVVTFAKTESLN